MLLIGSRAVILQFPEFREPRDWDLVGTAEEIERLATVLQPGPVHPRGDKGIFLYDGRYVEVANASIISYWGLVHEMFRNEPTIEEPVLGTLHVAPASFLLLTKQCGLIYKVINWHKNLADLYFLRDRVPAIPEHIASLMSHTIVDSKRMYGAHHAALRLPPSACHPSLPAPLNPELHAELHNRLAFGRRPLVEERGWEAFPQAKGDEKRLLMIQHFAEEAMVLAAEQFLMGKVGVHESVLVRWALRILITGHLPESWRYFGVNYYREIASSIPKEWSHRVADLAERVTEHASCDAEPLICDDTGALEGCLTA